MKKLILFTVILLSLNCRAQTSAKHEVQIGYGPLARELIFTDMVENFFRTIAANAPKHIDFSNASSITYHYQPKPTVAIGLASIYTSGTSYENYLFESKSHYNHKNAGLAFEVKFIYLQRSSHSLYSTIGLGGFLATEKDLDDISSVARTYTCPTAQFTPFGVRFGKKIGVFGELGYGYKGIATAGLNAKF
jgi:hypothetical protein